MIRRRPALSVTRMSPFGRTASAQGLASPLIGTTRYGCPSPLKTCGVSGRAFGRSQGAGLVTASCCAPTEAADNNKRDVRLTVAIQDFTRALLEEVSKEQISNHR